jgi:hypothetical protein
MCVSSSLFDSNFIGVPPRHWLKSLAAISRGLSSSKAKVFLLFVGMPVILTQAQAA